MNSRERRAQAYRAKCAAEAALGRKIEATLSGCSINVLTAVTAAPNWRNRAEPEFVTQENPEYRKVNNPYGQLTNARQKQRGFSIPLI